ncbi:hypothetical protein AK830_g12249, partial [Neonectria ditissima]
HGAEAQRPRARVPAHAGLVPVARGEGRQQREEGGAQGPVLLRREAAGGYGHVLDVLAVDEEPVLAVVAVVWVHQRREELDVAVGRRHVSDMQGTGPPAGSLSLVSVCVDGARSLQTVGV